jgi:heptosyltransferase-2
MAMHILVVKRGALGDVVRTSYFAEALKKKHDGRVRISWITAPAAVPLLCFNPHVDDVWTSFDEALPYRFDRVWSLDDEIDTLQDVARVKAASVSGAFLADGCQPTYSEDVAEWFDMGMLSRYGKQHADGLKKRNLLTHGRIFSKIFGVDGPVARFFGDPLLEKAARQWLGDGVFHLGINPFAGGRWPSKELPATELEALIQRLLALADRSSRRLDLVLLGAGADRQRNHALALAIGDARIRVAETDSSPLHLAALVRGLHYLVTSDSLAMHLAASQNVPFLAFFAPTSAAEIDDFGIGRKIASTAPDYCSYRKDADNSSITAKRIEDVLLSVIFDDGTASFHRCTLSNLDPHPGFQAG